VRSGWISLRIQEEVTIKKYENIPLEKKEVLNIRKNLRVD